MLTEAFTVEEFCHAYRISRSTFYRLLASGEGPAITRVNRRVLIPVDAAREWLRGLRDVKPNQ